MNSKEILMLEAEGLSKTICDYTTDNYITSYARKLNELDYQKDKEHLKLIVIRLNDWYTDNIDEIRGNKYLHNLNAHEKSYKIIQDLVYQFSNNQL